MVQCSPCLCISLQTGCKIIAILQIVFGTLLLILSSLGVLGLLYATSAYEEEDLDFLGKDFSVARLFCGILVCGSLTILFARLLWIGTRDKKAGKIRVWIYVNSAFFIFFLVVCWLVDAVTFNPDEFDWLWMGILAIHFYFIIVVILFMRSVHTKKQKNLEQKMRSLETENFL